MITLYDDHKGNKHLVNNVRHAASGHFSNNKRIHPKAIINELETKSKNTYFRDAYRHK
jgi:hypothetical protein